MGAFERFHGRVHNGVKLDGLFVNLDRQEGLRDKHVGPFEQIGVSVQNDMTTNRRRGFHNHGLNLLQRNTMSQEAHVKRQVFKIRQVQEQDGESLDTARNKAYKVMVELDSDKLNLLATIRQRAIDVRQ